MRGKIIVTITIIGILLFWLYFENNYLTINRINANFKKLPKEFVGYKIIHISDLHSKSFGFNQKRIVSIIKKQKPDLIAVTGDLIDKRIYREEPSLNLINQIVKIAPVYFVTGNHEVSSGKFDSLEAKLKQNGVKVLRNNKEEIRINGDKIYILGVDDLNSFYNDEEYAKKLKNMREGLGENSFTILLAHRPEKFPTYCTYGFDLIFSGHAHGGQIRVPLAGGLYSPHQGVFPKYTSGMYQDGMSAMVVSRGLGNTSIAPIRIFNKPELVVITLMK